MRPHQGRQGLDMVISIKVILYIYVNKKIYSISVIKIYKINRYLLMAR